MSYITEKIDQVVAATERNVDEEPLQKQVKTDTMQLEQVLDTSVHGQAPPPFTTIASKKKNKKSKAK